MIHFPPRTSKDATQIPSHVPDVQEVGIKGADANGAEPDQDEQRQSLNSLLSILFRLVDMYQKRIA